MTLARFIVDLSARTQPTTTRKRRAKQKDLELKLRENTAPGKLYVVQPFKLMQATNLKIP